MIVTTLIRGTALAGLLFTSVACTTVIETAAPIDAAPVAKGQPGYYRLWLGDFEIVALSDGTLMFQSEWLTNTTPAKVEKALAKQFLKAPFASSVNTFLVNTGSKLVLIDTGSGALFGPAGGKLVAHMAAAGYRPEQVDEIYITHLHADHVGGLMSEGKLTFPNAVVRADASEAGYWLSEENLAKAPEQMKSFFKGAQDSLGPYVTAGKFKPFEGDTDLVPGVKAVAAHGHTPGHTFYVAESKGQRIVFWGDLVHVAAVQLPTPSVTVAFDVDSKAAAAERKKAFAMLAKDGDLIGAAHIPFPGIGHLRADGKGYDWVPVNYSENP